MKKSLLPYVLVASIGIVAGVGVTAVIEDANGMPFESVNFDLFDPNNIDLDALIEMIAEHPEWTDAIFDWIKDHPEILENLDPSALADLIGEHPDMADDILKNLAEGLSPEELEQLLNDPALADLLAEHPELAAIAAGYIISQMGDLDFEGELPEPDISNSGSINGVGGNGTIDNGDLDPSDYATKIFSFTSDYAGQLYLRSASRGDYDSSSRSFGKAPSFDASTYYVSPLLFTGFSIAQSYSSPRAANIDMHMGSFRDEGMVVGDYVGSSFTVDGERGKFSRLYEDRLGRIDESEYSITCYPTANLGTSSFVIPNSLREDEKRYEKWVKNNYTDVPASLKSRLRGFLDNHNLRTPQDIENYLKNNYTYKVGKMDCPAGEDIVWYFLNEAEGGTCTNFASAMTLLCRTLDKPARFVTGYLCEAKRGENDVLGNQGHAWTEVYLSGTGWQRFDATASASTKPDENEPDASEIVVPNNEMAGNEEDESEKVLFTVESSGGSFNDCILLRSQSYDRYDPATYSFKPLVTDEDEEEWMNSLLFANKVAEWITLDDSFDANLTITYEDDYIAPGTLAPETVIGTTYTSDDKIMELVPADDSRLLRHQEKTATFHYLPGTYSYYYSVGSTENDGLLTASANYRNGLMASSHYIDYPSSYASYFESFIQTVMEAMGRSSRSELTPDDVNTFFETSMFLNSNAKQNPVTMDPILYLFGPEARHMSNRRNVLVGLEVLLLRYLGYRARFVDGFRINDRLSAQGPVPITYKDSYSWIELYDERLNFWVPMEVTSDEREEVHQVTYKFVENNSMYSSTYNGLYQVPSADCLERDYDASGDKGLYSGDYVRWDFGSGFLQAGTYRVRPKPSTSKVYNVFGDDVSDFYDLRIATGSNKVFTIGTKSITVRTDSFDVSVGFNPAYDPVSPAISDDLAPGDQIVLVYDDRAFDVAGVYDNSPSNIRIINEDGVDVTKSYSINLVLGKIHVS